MTEINTLRSGSTWQPGFEQRLHRRYLTVGYPEAAVEFRLDQIRARLGDYTVAEIDVEGVQVGFVVVGVRVEEGTRVGQIEDLWIESDHRTHDRADEARTWAEQWCAERGAVRVGVRLAEPNAAFDGYSLRSQGRFRSLLKDVASLPSGLTGRAMTPSEFTDWLVLESDAYIADLTASGAMSLAEAQKRSDKSNAELLPLGVETPDNTFWILEVDSAPVATIWLRHHFAPGVSYLYSVDVIEGYRGRGYGRSAMTHAEHLALSAGDMALALTVHGGNEVAMNLYSSTGYQVIEQYRSKELR